MDLTEDRLAAAVRIVAGELYTGWSCLQAAQVDGSRQAVQDVRSLYGAASYREQSLAARGDGRIGLGEHSYLDSERSEP